MKLKLKIASGPLQGREYPLHPGAIIGRSSAEITINDPKVSGRHAKIETNPAGELVMTDLGSSNGLRVENKKLTQVILRPGLLVQIGTTLCEIMLNEASSHQISPNEHATTNIDDETMPPPAIPSRPLNGPEFFSNFIVRSLPKIKSHPTALHPFKPLVVLTITHGLQAGTEWFFGYGPRIVGLGSLEFPLFDPGLPPQLFKIVPIDSDATFVTNHPDKVRLNGRSVSSEKLRPDDEITFLNTRIKVSFKNESSP